MGEESRTRREWWREKESEVSRDRKRNTASENQEQQNKRL